MENKIITITGCKDCPFAEESYGGFYCQIKDRPNKIADYTNNNKLKTPDWCPAKEKNILIKF